MEKFGKGRGWVGILALLFGFSRGLQTITVTGVRDKEALVVALIGGAIFMMLRDIAKLYVHKSDQYYEVVPGMLMGGAYGGLGFLIFYIALFVLLSMAFGVW